VPPLTGDGLGAVLRAGRQAALAWHALLEESEILVPFQRPELDIVTYFPAGPSMSAVDEASSRLFREAAALPPEEQVHLATYVVTGGALAARGHELVRDTDAARILRSTVMKPESGAAVSQIHATLERLARMT